MLSRSQYDTYIAFKAKKIYLYIRLLYSNILYKFLYSHKLHTVYEAFC